MFDGIEDKGLRIDADGVVGRVFGPSGVDFPWRDEQPATEPTEPGWYASADERLGLGLIFLRLPDIDVPGVIERHGAWRAYTADGDATDCVWAYIAPAGPVVRLTRPAR
jgi:hypothetical protein